MFERCLKDLKDENETVLLNKVDEVQEWIIKSLTMRLSD